MERNLVRIAGALSGRGIESSILLLHHHQDTLPLPPNIPLYRVITGPRDPRMAVGIWRMLRRIQPTVIHARNWGAWPDTAAARMLTYPRAPLIFSYHGMEGREVSVSQRLKFQAMARFTNRIFAVSDAARRLLVDEYGLVRESIGVISNGVDTERFHPRAPRDNGEEHRRIVIGSVGRFFRIKNLPLLLRAAHRLIGEGLDIEVRVAGEGPELPQVKALALELGLGDRLRLLGDVVDVQDVFRTFDVYVLSSDNEANPNSLIEGMASGLACVSTRVGNVPELLDEGRAGALIAPGDEIALAAALRELIQSPDLRTRLGEAARQRAVMRYSQARMLDAYEALYRAPLGATLD
jgi:glycosyltransferase involved in cell wall biosynthesis